MHTQNLKGIILMIAAATSIAALYTSMKFVTISVNSNQAVFFYKLTVLIFLLPWIFYKDGIKAIYTPNFALHFYRSIFSTAGSLTLMYALKSLRLIDVTILTQLEQMLWLVMGAFFFNEKLNLAKILAIIIGLTGGLIIIKPELIHNTLFADKIDIPEFNTAYIFIAATIACWSINSFLIKVLGNKKATNRAQLFYVMSFASLFSYFVAFVDWDTTTFLNFEIYRPTGFNSIFNVHIQKQQIIGIAVASICYLSHSVFFFNALRYGEMTVIAPFVYFKLIFAGILGYILFNETPKMTISYLGYALIIFAGLLLITSQYKAHKKAQKLALEAEDVVL